MIARPETPLRLPRVSILAFCETEPVMEAITAAFAHPALARARTSIMPARAIDVEGFSKNISAEGVPGALIIEVGEQANQEEIMRRLTKYAAYCDQETVVFVIGHRNDITLYRALLSEGVADYLVAPVSADQIVQALAGRLAREEAADKTGRTIAVIAARGGAGATTVAANLAWILAEERRQPTCLVDLAGPFGAVATALDCQPDPELSALLYSPELITDAETLQRMLIRKTDRFAVLCATPNLEAAGRRHNDAGMTHLLKLLRAEFAYTVLDVPLHWISVIENILVKANQVVLVTTPDFSGIPPAQTLFRYLLQMRDDTLVVLNQSRPKSRDNWDIADVLRALNVQQALQIPADDAFPGSVAQGRALCDLSPSRPAARELRRLAAAICGDLQEEQKGWAPALSHMFDRWTRRGA